MLASCREPSHFDEHMNAGSHVQLVVPILVAQNADLFANDRHICDKLMERRVEV